MKAWLRLPSHLAASARWTGELATEMRERRHQTRWKRKMDNHLPAKQAMHTRKEIPRCTAQTQPRRKRGTKDW